MITPSSSTRVGVGVRDIVTLLGLNWSTFSATWSAGCYEPKVDPFWFYTVILGRSLGMCKSETSSQVTVLGESKFRTTPGSVLLKCRRMPFASR